MTEDEAKTKWCPKIEHRGWGKCIGSGCMAWRWMLNVGENPENPAEATILPPVKGYCGLGGRP
jgi:hypothetical protein